jgi:hypothetical protein
MILLQACFGSRVVWGKGRQPATGGPHAALATFLCDPSHGLGMFQCENGKKKLPFGNTLYKRKGKQNKHSADVGL